MTRSDKERFAVLVHEVRSPVAALRAIAETCRGNPAATNERRRFVELAVAACRGIERLVRDVTVSSVRPEPLDSRRLVEEAAAAAVLGGGNVRVEVDAGLPRISADPLRLRQALDNLVSNALRYGGTSTEVVIRAQPGRSSVLFSVADQGPGIPLDEQERIFEAGARLDSRQPGSGLGLAVARAIAEAHGGTLTIDSIPGEGARFTIALPVA